MINPKNLLVVTTSSLEGISIKRYLKPVSAHVVAGTNVFSDVFAAFSDVFGGRSQSYQKQISSIYNEAIEKIKIAAFELGANCVIGLHVDMDEISGKGKSMFMITAVGTAVVIEENTQSFKSENSERIENVSIEKIKILQRKKEILKDAEKDILFYNDDIWNFIITNRVIEILPHLLNMYSTKNVQDQENANSITEFHNQFAAYINEFPEYEKLAIIYNAIENSNSNQLTINLMLLIKQMQLLDFNHLKKLIDNENNFKRKVALNILTYDKAYYDKEDIETLTSFKKYIETNFKERGTRSTKKQMLSSKEKDVWICECGKTNDGLGKEDEYCDSCGLNIYGFKKTEINPKDAIKSIEEKIELISELIS